MLKASLFVIIFTILLIVGSTPSVWAAQLGVILNPEYSESELKITFQRTVRIEYPEGGNVEDLLRGTMWSNQFSADSSTPGMQELMKKLNDKITADGTSARITDLKLDYSVEANAREFNTSIDYKIVLTPTLSFYTIREFTPGSPALIDMAWRGLTVTGPVVIDGVEINQPISAIQEFAPDVYQLISGTEADLLLSQHLINSDGIKMQPLSNWHFLFDPTGINVDASRFGLSEEISGFVVSSYTMGESSIREGRQVEKELKASFVADREYTVRTFQSADSAEVDVIGFAVIERQYGIELFGVSPRTPEGFAQTSTGEFPVMIIYGMAGMAGVGAIAILFISNRKLKKDEAQGMTQTGIDPSLLRGMSTSAGSGGYQTVRGEAHLTGDYEQTRSVYEEEKKDESASASTKGSLPKGWKPKK